MNVNEEDSHGKYDKLNICYNLWNLFRANILHVKFEYNVLCENITIANLDKVVLLLNIILLFLQQQKETLFVIFFNIF